MSDELAWFKSSYSDSEGSACVEVAAAPQGATVHLRDSKVPDGSRLAFAGTAFSAFLTKITSVPM